MSEPSKTSQGVVRCAWVGSDPLYEQYHDTEWGVPVRDDRLLFEALTLDGAQAGLSWLTVLRKRENYRKAFDLFDPVRVAAYTEEDVQRLLGNPGIIRNQLKVRSAITNARAFLQVQEEFGEFAKFLWSFVEDRPIQNSWKHVREVPATSPESDRLSEELRRRGFKFAGSTICYALMQAVGMVNDHTTDCPRYKEVRAMAELTA